ncbi:AAA family ATPase [Gordonia sp. L191]|uniref:ATP-dependent nuclease n=1 Tax=Gordonia sp. L191 TaxID=2982699 RepID=UPI0024C0C6FC|nr:AAA family ATPase [Gordonia sp. L191]WHU46820.1 AAA family ATPase [Gordonia sp. L191]
MSDSGNPDTISALRREFERGKCEPFIRQIRFPRFKNLRYQEIDFTYPITALIGSNGTNKSSILRAIQSCPDQYNIGDFWFDTTLDPIDEPSDSGDEGPQRYIHTYLTPSGATAEVIKSRVLKASRGLDYFETERPRARDGMSKMPDPGDPADSSLRNKTRWSPIKKNVTYLDFRQELPAYDILMHFSWRHRHNGTTEKKASIRRNSKHVGNALSNLKSTYYLYNADRILEQAEELSANELRWVGKILGRSYSSIRLVKHDFFGVEGWTATMSVTGRTYSEAYAGSGEFAAIMLVRAIMRSPKNSLILLDEPETSLHPAAQTLLMTLIIQECKAKGHQVVMATHAPAMVAVLPDEARKLLEASPTGEVRVVAQSASQNEAFVRVGADFSPRTIVVEDALAKEIVLRACRARGEDFLRSVDVVYVPGGASTVLNTVIPVQAAMGGHCKVLLDGDQHPPSPLIPGLDPNRIPDLDLRRELAFLGVTKPPKDSDDDNSERRCKQLRQILNWFHSNVDYLPSFNNPDKLLADICGYNNVGRTTPQAKEFWVERTREALGVYPDETVNSVDILTTQRTELASVPDQHPSLLELGATLDRFLS